ncbi:MULTISPECIES: beta-ketoacyl synthase N-terminal-like domain-containing protein [unclassified Campylobacter]|uniref:beta-ketoacyl synthase N-terminal-like domain-containing protein n=1 Tax=unclassified Campylobacter TaxID=2593542 RepID=UPI0022E9A576|nr:MULTISPECIES: beta-ketoacyl synthase N-terminal-like domain-containing protein [unclassified Campylobacter]MDA3055921.1 beta-ACP synthase [Campylobacter sp. CN_NA1]MDA3066121.1 beta-ACP synthase [Campylobacter sp. CN_NE4]MDA3069406.1 beta-ACP synthase [Campylobacter sp. CN_NE3]MDA3082520.1 beta-ACP synthase [Campylobacter sp. CN_EL2]MDA3083742.1 beta-ACP synthase [Campylobacter sp. CN_NE1]
MQIYLSSPGLISSAGNDTNAVFKAVCDKNSAIKKIENFYNNKSFVLGKISQNLDQICPKFKGDFANRTNQILFLAFMQIENEIKNAIAKFGSHRVGVVIGTTVTGVQSNFKAFENHAKTGEFKGYNTEQNSQGNPANFVRDFFGLKSVAVGISSACTSGNKAVIEAARLIKSGICDAVICGGSDGIDTLTVLGFESLGVLSDERLNPFSLNRKGTNLGEGAGVFLLSRDEISDIALLSYHANSDAFHITKPNPNATMQIEAINLALQKAGLDEVDYVNLHGTGTNANDIMESVAISSTLKNTPCSSSKPIFGHTLGAAGAIELGICFQAIKNGILPPQIYDKEQILPKINIIDEKIQTNIKTAMNLSFAFGGDNAVSVIGKI